MFLDYLTEVDSIWSDLETEHLLFFSHFTHSCIDAHQLYFSFDECK